MTNPAILKTFLWYQKDLGKALDFYQNIFKENMKVHERTELGGGEVFTADFSILGQEFIGMSVEGGPDFNDSISLHVICDGQSEVDYYWDALTADGGVPGNCGWLKDKFGLSWQVTPIQMREYLGNPDPQAAEFAMTALRNMHKIVLADFVK
ncbi:MAG: hypothetical protein RL228_724 [Actinomycetota bacterium]